MNLPELITIGSNTLDVIIDIDDILRFELFDKDIIKKYTAIEYSRKLNVKNVRFIPGGSGANIAANCSMLGLNSTYIGVMGNDFSAEICLTDLKKRGVDLSQVIQTDADTTALSIILRTPWGKDRSILAYKGANNLLKPSDVKEELFNNIRAFAWTSLTTEDSCKAIEKAITLTKNKGGMVFAAPSMSIIKNAPNWAKILISNSDVVSLNLEEAQEFTGENKKTLMIKIFLDMGIKLISITDGPNGSIISDGKTIINSGVYSAGKVEDTTGAGDAFLTGILISRLNNISLEKTSKIATAMSFLESKEIGVREGLPNSIQELEDFVSNNTIKQVISEIV
ncbi:MAG: carbohydrate kinase family protein [Candidatus Lokiarchaeota archaeon]|nr:carbohydrate kinase family protein [Candidatus Lokiarchaeota archaeon]